MRSLLVFFAVFSALPLAVVFPFVGLLLWAWISFMFPHREAFGLAADFPFNWYIALVTLGAWLFSAEPKRLPVQPLSVLLIAFAILFSITTYFAMDYPFSYELWDRHIRTFALVLLVMMLATSKLRIQALLWVIAISIGYYAVKGGGFILFTGSFGAKIFGPEGTQIADNNDLSLAIVMSIPILHYLRMTSANPIVKAACVVVMAFSVLSIIGTFSRGGFIGLAAVAVAFVVLSRPKFGALIIPAALGLAVWMYAPQAWFERIDSINNYQNDLSAQGRFESWNAAWKLALDRPLVGGGFSALERDKIRFRYAKSKTTEVGRAAHSMWFQVLGDHGFVGLALYLCIIFASIYNALRVVSLSRNRSDLAWATLLSRMMVVMFAGYVTAGSLLSMAYYDAFLTLAGLTAALRVLVEREVASTDGVIDEVSEPLPATAGWRSASVSRK